MSTKTGSRHEIVFKSWWKIGVIVWFLSVRWNSRWFVGILGGSLEFSLWFGEIRWDSVPFSLWIESWSVALLLLGLTSAPAGLAAHAGSSLASGRRDLFLKKGVVFASIDGLFGQKCDKTRDFYGSCRWKLVRDMNFRDILRHFVSNWRDDMKLWSNRGENRCDHVISGHNTLIIVKNDEKRRFRTVLWDSRRCSVRFAALFGEIRGLFPGAKTRK